jgi:hypothetical protein
MNVWGSSHSLVSCQIGIGVISIIYSHKETASRDTTSWVFCTERPAEPIEQSPASGGHLDMVCSID